MILSFHPLFEGDENRLCAGREPDKSDRAAIQRAQVVILPQGCKEALYIQARLNCTRVFPNYDVRFLFPGKIGQISLFRRYGVHIPPSREFDSVREYQRCGQTETFNYPMVFKFDWGGEGETVHLVANPEQLDQMLTTARSYEKTGQRGFVIQRYIPHHQRTLRVVVIGDTIESYWRCQDNDTFGTSLVDGARIDHDAAPQLQRRGQEAVQALCRRTGINLAGFDLLFDVNDPAQTPIFLEINYFFGRQGLGGAERYYKLLHAAISRWLASIRK